LFPLPPLRECIRWARSVTFLLTKMEIHPDIAPAAAYVSLSMLPVPLQFLILNSASERKALLILVLNSASGRAASKMEKNMREKEESTRDFAFFLLRPHAHSP
jgi:hypothetical protein